MEKVLDIGSVLAEIFQEVSFFHTVMHFHLVLFYLFSDDQVNNLDLFVHLVVRKLIRVKSMIDDSFVKKLLEIFAEMEVRHVL